MHRFPLPPILFPASRFSTNRRSHARLVPRAAAAAEEPGLGAARLAWLLSALTALVLLLTAVDSAQAKKMGGGKSFGSKDSYSQSYQKQTPPPGKDSPGMQRQAAPGQPGPAAQGGFFSRFGGIGAMMGGILMGGMLGALLFGGGFGGVGILEILLLGLAAFLIVRFIRSRRAAARGDTQPQASPTAFGGDRLAYVGPAGGYSAHSRDDDRAMAQRQAREPFGVVGHTDGRHGASGQAVEGQAVEGLAVAGRTAEGRRAEVMAVAGRTAVGRDAEVLAAARQAAPEFVSPRLPAGIDEAEFLSGARALFTRLQASWDRRDLEDIKSFTTPEVHAEIARQAGLEPASSRTEVMTLSARVIDVETNGQRTVISVLFEALLREDQARAEWSREVWHMGRDEKDTAPRWRLEGIQQVRD